MSGRRSSVARASRVLAVLAAAALTACSGSGSTIPSKTATQRAGRAAASFVMHWPGLRTSSGVRRAKYISPSTKSVAIEVNDDASLTKKVDTPVTNGQPQTSTVAFEAPVGADTITFSLWDQPGATGNELGQATIAVTIASGKTNTVSATIDGLIASVDFAPLPNQPTVTTATDSSGTTAYTISGDLPVTFAAAAKDADGNVIIANGSPIAYSATASTAAFALSPVAGQANQFVVRAQQPPAQGATYAIVAHATDGQGGLGQTNYGVSLAELTYIAYENGGSGTIAAFDASGKRIPLPGTFPGLHDPIALAYDISDHRLFVVDKATQSLLAFGSDGTAIASGYAAPSLAGINGVAFDTHTATLYVPSSNDAVSAYTVAGAPVATPGGFPLLAHPVGIYYYDPLNALFVANAGNNTVSHYAEDGTTIGLGQMNRPSYSTGSVVPTAIGGNGNGLFVVGGNDGTSDLLAEILITGASGGTIATGVSAPAGIAYDLATDSFFVADNASGNVTVYDSALAGLVTTIPAPSAFSQPTSLTFIY